MATTSPPRVTPVTDALIVMLAAKTGMKVGDGDAPPELVDDQGYLIVHELVGAHSEGDAAFTEGTRYQPYQIIAVGGDRHAAGAARDRAHGVLLARTQGSGAFVNAIDAYTARDQAHTARSLATDDHLAVVDRAASTSGGITQEGVVFNAVEQYELWICPT